MRDTWDRVDCLSRSLKASKTALHAAKLDVEFYKEQIEHLKGSILIALDEHIDAVDKDKL